VAEPAETSSEADWTFTVATGREDRAISGMDSIILNVPDGAYVTVDDGPPALNVRGFSRFLRELAESQAHRLGEELHHAEFRITTDPSIVESWGTTHDCEECRAGTNAALRRLREAPQTPLLVGLLYWGRMRRQS
jgi:hypothetical protein